MAHSQPPACGQLAGIAAPPLHVSLDFLVSYRRPRAFSWSPLPGRSTPKVAVPRRPGRDSPSPAALARAALISEHTSTCQPSRPPNGTSARNHGQPTVYMHNERWFPVPGTSSR
jgi:hypothetical protein